MIVCIIAAYVNFKHFIRKYFNLQKHLYLNYDQFYNESDKMFFNDNFLIDVAFVLFKMFD